MLSHGLTTRRWVMDSQPQSETAAWPQGWLRSYTIITISLIAWRAICTRFQCCIKKQTVQHTSTLSYGTQKTCHAQDPESEHAAWNRPSHGNNGDGHRMHSVGESPQETTRGKTRAPKYKVTITTVTKRKVTTSRVRGKIQETPPKKGIKLKKWKSTKSDMIWSAETLTQSDWSQAYALTQYSSRVMSPLYGKISIVVSLLSSQSWPVLQAPEAGLHQLYLQSTEYPASNRYLHLKFTNRWCEMLRKLNQWS